MRKTMFVATALALLAGSASQAQQSPPLREIMETIEINASADKVWKVVGDTEDGTWVSNVVSTLEQGGDPATSTRTQTLSNGRTIVEKGSTYDPEHRSFAYAITERDPRDLPAGEYSATIKVEPAGDGRAIVQWKAAFSPSDPKANPPTERDEATSEKKVRDWIHGSLEHLKVKLEKGNL